MRHLTLAGYVAVTTPVAGGFQQRIATLDVPVGDGERHVTVPNLLYRYGDTGMVAAPMVSLSGTTVSYDLSCWNLFDVLAERAVGELTFSNTEPSAALMLDVAERYVREARGLSSFELSAWIVRVVEEANSR
jgi:hypothetical protein